MPAVRGVAERAEVGVVRRFDHDPGAGLSDAVELFDRADDIGDVLDDVDEPDLREDAVAERQLAGIDVGDDVGSGVRIAVDPDGVRAFVLTTTDVKA